MATLETQVLDNIIVRSRRKMLSLGTSALAGLVLAGVTKKAEAATLGDADYLNFALNLEYLEANFYNLAVHGQTIDKLSTPISITGTGTQGVVLTKGSNNYASCKVPFTLPIIAAYAAETATEEGKHVSFLRGALSTSAVAQPQIDLVASFNALAMGAGLATPVAGQFDPFANDATFLIGAYIFEDVGVTAYHGAAGALTVAANLGAAGGILAVEAYHAGLVRTSIAQVDSSPTFFPVGTLQKFTQQISAFRSLLANPSSAPTKQITNGGITGADDQGLDNTQMVALQGTSATYISNTILDADNNSICFSRTPAQILSIVTGNSPAKASGNTGVFFPAGLNGNVN